MNGSATQRRGYVLASLSLALMASMTGCQADYGGQTLPSPYYLQDDVQYFPTGPEFKLSREAAAMENLQRGNVIPSSPPVMPAPMGPVVPVPAPGAEAVPAPPAAPVM